MAKKDQEASWEKKRHKSPPKNDVPPVPEIQGKAKTGEEKVISTIYQGRRVKQ